METIATLPPNQATAAEHSLGALNDIDAARLISAAADISFVIDAGGIIRQVTLGSDELSKEDCQSWVGHAWVDVVSADSRSKAAELLQAAAAGAPTRWRHVNHPSSQGIDIPIRFAAVQVGNDGQVVVVGRDLRAVATLQRRLMDAQYTMEREYSRLRSSETRYRLLFQIASEAVLIMDAENERIIEANPVADQMLGKMSARVAGRNFSDFFDPASAATVRSMLASTRSIGRADDVEARLNGNTGNVSMTASLFRQENSSHILVRLTPRQANDNVSGTRRGKSTLLKVVERLPDGFVVTDPEWRILTANAAFLDLAQIATEELACSESLERFLGRTGVDFNVLTNNLREHGSVRQFATGFRSIYGVVENVEVTAVAVPDQETPCFGFTIRSSDHRVPAAPQLGRETPRSVEQLTELVGRVSLKDLVRESTDLIERLAIEAALELTGDNRASAADMLGLSRQSLYVKLRRYGLGDLETVIEN